MSPSFTCFCWLCYCLLFLYLLLICLPSLSWLLEPTICYPLPQVSQDRNYLCTMTMLPYSTVPATLRRTAGVSLKISHTWTVNSRSLQESVSHLALTLKSKLRFSLNKKKLKLSRWGSAPASEPLWGYDSILHRVQELTWRYLHTSFLVSSSGNSTSLFSIEKLFQGLIYLCQAARPVKVRVS